MMILKSLKTAALLAFMALTSTPSQAQDLLARQAPVDRKMKAVDSIVLHRLIEQEMYENPAGDLYDEWDNQLTHYSGVALPDEATIDLRGFCMPTPSRVVTSNFGARWGRQHKGLDIKVYIGDTIRAAFSGKVRIVKYEPKGYGKYVVIRHYNGLETYYGHMSKQLVTENQEVNAGDPIGLGGNTGRSTGSHLHFETRLCGVALNPALMFDFRNQDVVGDSYMFRKSTYENEGQAANALRGKVGNGGYVASDVRGETIPGGGEAKEASAAKQGQQVVSPQRAMAEVRYHKVAAGETLYSISKRRGVTVDQLCKMNHINKNMKVRVGQLLRYS
jgi:murein DD-endopeptidase MepM/ murein hydrolase activator NlpD